MTKQEFIFSTKASHRVARHLLFWTLYSIYFWIQSINPWGVEEFSQANTYLFAFYSVCCFVPTCIISTYLTIYLLLPFVLEKKKYALFTACFFLMVGMDLSINYLTAGVFIANAENFKIQKGYEFYKQLGLAETNVKWAVTISLIGMGIKLTKKWYLQEKENLEISRKKIRLTLQLQKSRINPDLLFHSLRNIQQKISTGATDSASTLLKLSDLLSYSLYESDTELVPLDNELTAINDFVFLKNSVPENNANIDIQIIGSSNEVFVSPILLPLFKDICGLTRNSGNNFISAEFHHQMSNNCLQVKIHFSTYEWEVIDHSNFNFTIEEFKRRLSDYGETGNFFIDQDENEKTIFLSLPLIHRARKHTSIEKSIYS